MGKNILVENEGKVTYIIRSKMYVPIIRCFLSPSCLPLINNHMAQDANEIGLEDEGK